MGSGGFFSLQSSIVSQILGSHRLGQGMGWLEVAESFGYFAGPVSAGALLQTFGGPGQGAAPYRPAMVSRYKVGNVLLSTDSASMRKYLVGGATAASFLVIVSVRYSTARNFWRRV
jgi:hypothetical protein